MSLHGDHNTGYAVDMDAVMKDVKMEMGRRGVRFQEEEREWRLPGLLYADHLVLCGELQEDLRAMVGHFVNVCTRRSLKVNAGKSKVMVLGGEGGECKVCEDGMRWSMYRNLNIWDYFGQIR